LIRHLAIPQGKLPHISNSNYVRNVYHHLNDLCGFDLVTKIEGKGDGSRYLYELTKGGLALKDRYRIYMKILKSIVGQPNM